jgi:hypothetical protein
MHDTSDNVSSEYPDLDILHEQDPIYRKGMLVRFEEWLFSKMHRTSRKRSLESTSSKPDSERPLTSNKVVRVDSDPMYGFPLHKKSLAETVTLQIKNGYGFRVSHIVVTGFALLTFTIGAILIYSNLPTHPELVAGIVLVALSSSVITKG